jgi:hypothetical protein
MSDLSIVHSGCDRRIHSLKRLPLSPPPFVILLVLSNYSHQTLQVQVVVCMKRKIVSTVTPT